MVTVISSDLKVSMEDLEDEDCPSVLFGCFYKKGNATLTKKTFANNADKNLEMLRNDSYCPTLKFSAQTN